MEKEKKMFDNRQSELAKGLEERIANFENLQDEYDKINRKLDPVAKSDMLEEILMKIELILSMLMKFQRNLIIDRNDISSYMYKSDIETTLSEVREYIKSYQGMAFATSEVLRSVRIKIENLYELQKLNMKG